MRKNQRKPYAGYKRAHLMTMIGSIVLGLCLIIATIVMVCNFKVEVKVEQQPVTANTQQPIEQTPAQKVVNTTTDNTPTTNTPTNKPEVAEATETGKDNPVVAPAETEEPAEILPAYTEPEAAETEEVNPIVNPEETEEPGEVITPVEEEPAEEIQHTTVRVTVNVYTNYGNIKRCKTVFKYIEGAVGSTLTRNEIEEMILAMYPDFNEVSSLNCPESYTFTEVDGVFTGTIKIKIK